MNLHLAANLDEVSPLPVLDGPWNAATWLIERPARFVTSGDQSCAVRRCQHKAGRATTEPARPTDVLCIPHRRRHMKEGGGASAVDEFVEQQAQASPIRQPRGAATAKEHYAPVHFHKVHPRLANELRYVTSLKVLRQHWQHPQYVNKVLTGAIDFANRTGTASLTEFETVAVDTGTPIPGNTRDALGSMIDLVHRARTDPWENEVWHPVDLGMTDETHTTRSGTQIYWNRTTCDWLRLGLMELAKTRLQAGTVAWSTLRSYARGGSLLSAYMEQVGEVQPEDLSRAFFLEFTAWVRDETTGRNDIGAVTSLAVRLREMRADNIVPALPDTMFLLRGENPNPKIRKPKPLPADTLDRIDALLADTSVAFPIDTRLMLRLFRAACPRPSEVMSLPIDSIEHGKRGYSLRYHQAKVDKWRVVPLPPLLGEALAAQAEQVKDRYPDCNLLFPYAPPVGRTNTMLDDTHGGYEAWSYARFAETIWVLYQQYGIGRSSLTGEQMTGAQLHRFRHSVATALLAEGWSQYEVQKFLGHESPTMMQAYAEIHETDLHNRYVEFVEQNVDIKGQHQDISIDVVADGERLRDRMVRSTLPNGYCTLPEKQTCDFLPNPCLSCAMFRTTPTFLPIHIRQRDESLVELDLAKREGRERAAEVHERTANTLTRIIESLEDDDEEVPA